MKILSLIRAVKSSAVLYAGVLKDKFNVSFLLLFKGVCVSVCVPTYLDTPNWNPDSLVKLLRLLFLCEGKGKPGDIIYV